MSKQLKNISKLMSLVLRHKPEIIELNIDEHGWARVDELVEKINTHGINVSLQMIEEIVDTNDKKRFAFNADKSMIRASQGHSLLVSLDLPSVMPPDILYHGTAEKYVESILRTGLQKQTRQHVHLSDTIDTARAVGGRHGKPVILTIDAKRMHQTGINFYLSENKVWLVDTVPVEYIQI